MILIETETDRSNQDGDTDGKFWNVGPDNDDEMPLAFLLEFAQPHPRLRTDKPKNTPA